MTRKIPVHPASAPLPAGPYTHAIMAGGFVFVSGQTPEKPGTSETVQGDIKVQTRQVMENIRAILAAAGCSMDDVVKVSAHLADIEDFTGYNAVYREYFAEPYPARITVQSVLPGDALLEVDVIALCPDKGIKSMATFQGGLMASGRLYPNVRDIWAARKTISPVVHKTPLIRSPELSDRVNASVFLKLENLHETGAFKIRGAANKILNLTPDERKRGVITFSTGNHGLAVAWVAKKMGIPAVVCISQRVPGAKVEALRRMGAAIEIHGSSQDEAEAYCYKLAEERDLSVIKAFDDPFVIAGQGTIGLELLEELPEIDTVIVPLSGGGLIAGVALALKSNDPDLRVIGVSMERGAVMHHSLKAGAPVVLEEEDTLADSLLGGIGQDNQYSFEMVKRYVDDTVLVSEEAIAEGMAFLFNRHRLVVEGAAATGIAAVMQRGIVAEGSNVAVIVTGNNVDVPAFLGAIKKRL